MCIRDSGYCKYGQLDVIQEKYSLLTRRVETVSYTHLDVYKRQVYAIAASVCVFSQYSVLPVVLQGKA